jgi:hypothetical protein
MEQRKLCFFRKTQLKNAVPQRAEAFTSAAARAGPSVPMSQQSLHAWGEQSGGSSGSPSDSTSSSTTRDGVICAGLSRKYRSLHLLREKGNLLGEVLRLDMSSFGGKGFAGNDTLLSVEGA